MRKSPSLKPLACRLAGHRPRYDCSADPKMAPELRRQRRSNGGGWLGGGRNGQKRASGATNGWIRAPGKTLRGGRRVEATVTAGLDRRGEARMPDEQAVYAAYTLRCTGYCVSTARTESDAISAHPATTRSRDSSPRRPMRGVAFLRLDLQGNRPHCTDILQIQHGTSCE